MRAKHIVHFNELKSIFCQGGVCAFLINGKNVSYLLEVLPVAFVGQALPAEGEHLTTQQPIHESRSASLRFFQDGIQNFCKLMHHHFIRVSTKFHTLLPSAASHNYILVR